VNPIRWDLGDGLIVRTYIAGDAQELFRLIDANRERLRPWMIWEPQTTSVADSLAYIERSASSSTDMEGNGVWLDGMLIAGVGLGVDTLSNSGEIGYWIDGGHEGKGIITRVCERFFDFAFEELGLHRMELQAASGNMRSRAVAERLGMAQEGVARDGIRVADGYLDSVVYAILEDEWRARRVPG
jgi:ribosomal-protein-serine acetyltransferase